MPKDLAARHYYRNDGSKYGSFYDILSYLSYADAKLHRVKLAMRKEPSTR